MWKNNLFSTCGFFQNTHVFFRYSTCGNFFSMFVSKMDIPKTMNMAFNFSKLFFDMENQISNDGCSENPQWFLTFPTLLLNKYLFLKYILSILIKFFILFFYINIKINTYNIKKILTKKLYISFRHTVNSLILPP